MKLKFSPMPTLFPDIPVWGAVGGHLTFVISLENDRFTATAKPLGSPVFGGVRHELGGHNAHVTFKSAVEACERFLHDETH